MKLLAIALLALVVGCAPTAKTPSADPPATTVYAAKTSYQAVLIVAVAYNKLPRCGQPTSPTICSDTNVVTQLRKADASAQAALDAAETVVRTPGTKDSVALAAAVSATEAVKVLQTILTAYSIK